MRKSLRISITSLAVLIGFLANSQDSGFMYGTVTTIDDDAYTGAIRWGKEEVYWTDMFNASKEKNENIKYMDDDALDQLEDQKKGFWGDNDSWWGDWSDNDYIHQFACQFGEISMIEITGRSKADVTMQNGLTVEVNGSGYNDIGTSIKIFDSELGIVSLDWDRVETIKFMKTPSKLKEKFGEPLFGKVETSEGTFEGYVQWDHDERVSEDKLDGDTEDGDLSIKFGNIESIERFGSSRSEVVLKSGRTLVLRGSNDVNDGNRGIIVTVEGLGRVDVPWDEFDKVTFSEVKSSGPEYQSFESQNPLKAKVLDTNGKTYEGLLSFDLDEQYDFEILHGMLEDIEVMIPFRNIKEFEPRNYEYASVLLKNGKKMVLGESQDVSDKNTGMLVKSGNDYQYITYKDVEKIIF
ncbi:MAG: hypothetical protein JXR10_17380 [Cyclobacteriaceae bacterium]